MINNPFESLYNVIATSPKDYALEKRDIWIYGIVCGWNDESLANFQEKYSWWEDSDTERLKHMHKDFEKARRNWKNEKLEV